MKCRERQERGKFGNELEEVEVVVGDANALEDDVFFTVMDM